MTAHHVPLLVCDHCRSHYLGPLGADPDATIPETRRYAIAQEGWRRVRGRDGMEDWCGACLDAQARDLKEML